MDPELKGWQQWQAAQEAARSNPGVNAVPSPLKRGPSFDEIAAQRQAVEQARFQGAQGPGGTEPPKPDLPVYQGTKRQEYETARDFNSPPMPEPQPRGGLIDMGKIVGTKQMEGGPAPYDMGKLPRIGGEKSEKTMDRLKAQRERVAAKRADRISAKRQRMEDAGLPRPRQSPPQGRQGPLTSPPQGPTPVDQQIDSNNRKMERYVAGGRRPDKGEQLDAAKVNETVRSNKEREGYNDKMVGMKEQEFARENSREDYSRSQREKGLELAKSQASMARYDQAMNGLRGQRAAYIEALFSNPDNATIKEAIADTERQMEEMERMYAPLRREMLPQSEKDRMDKEEKDARNRRRDQGRSRGRPRPENMRTARPQKKSIGKYAREALKAQFSQAGGAST